MEKKFVDIQLEIEVNGNMMLAHLVFSNNTADKIYLDKKTICTSGKVRRNIFNITDEDNKAVIYTGMMEKRIVVPEDFIPFNAGEKIETSIVLNEIYKVNKGHKYIVQYSVYNPSYNKGGINKMESNKVEVNY